MNRRRSRFAPALTAADGILESRLALSAAGAAHHGAAEVARKAATTTTLQINAGTLGQPVTFTVTVRAPAAAGPPQGTVNLLNHGQVFQQLTLTPTTSTKSRFAYSQATYTLTPLPGGAADYFGKYTVNAAYVPGAGFVKSAAKKSFEVNPPTYRTQPDGVQISTIKAGSGPQVQAGQTASVFYTGYLASNGQIFDDSVKHGGAPMSFTVGAGRVIPGFDEGVAGMQAGESRIVVIPPAEGYGATANGPIPPNSTLIFVVTLHAIS